MDKVQIMCPTRKYQRDQAFIIFTGGLDNNSLSFDILRNKLSGADTVRSVILG